MLLFENSCAFFVLWIVLGVWKFVLFSVVFFCFFFLCSGLCYYKIKKSGKARSTKFVLWIVLGVWEFVLFSGAFSGTVVLFFVLWIVLGVWEFVLFSGAFSGAPF